MRMHTVGSWLMEHDMDAADKEILDHFVRTREATPTRATLVKRSWLCDDI